MILNLSVKPGSKKGPLLVKNPDGSFVVYLRERPHDGEANVALLKLLSKHFSVPKTSIKIKSGLASHQKNVELPD